MAEVQAQDNSMTSTADVYCPHCGYNLRGHVGSREAERCSECGAAYSPKDLSGSRIPWVHRGEVGRVKAFLRTIWVATLRSDVLGQSHEEERGQWPAAMFRWICTLLMALAVAGLCVTIARPLSSGVPVLLGASGKTSILTTWAPQLGYPLAIAYSRLWLVLPLSLGFCVSLGMLPVRVAGFALLEPSKRGAVTISAQYLVAALIGGAPFGLGVSAVLSAAGMLLLAPSKGWRAAMEVFVVFTPATAVLCWFLACWRFYRDAALHATGRAFLPGWFLLPSVLLVAVIWFVVIPCCLGLIYLAVTGLLR